MNENSELILKQVALKSAIKLTKNSFDVSNDINTQLDVIKNISTNLFEYLKDGYETKAVTVPNTRDVEVAYGVEPNDEQEQKVTYKYGNDTNSGDDTASDGQKKFVRDLFAKLPNSEKEKYDKDVNGKTMSWQFAKEHIPLFQEIIEKAEKVQDTAPF